MTIKSFVSILFITVCYSYGFESSERRYAIAEFDNLAKVKQYDWYSEALADMLTTDLSKVIKVVARKDLKEIIKEQELSLQGAIDEQKSVEIGKLVGANRLLKGTYLITGSLLRIDIKVYNVESGLLDTAISIEGNTNEFLKIQKQLLGKTISALGMDVNPADNFEIYQLPTKNSLAIENNYNGVLKLDHGDSLGAKRLFEESLLYDSTYSVAKENYDVVANIKMESGTLVTDLKFEIANRENQLDVLKKITRDLYDNYWDLKVVGKEILPEGNTNSVVVDINFDINSDAALHFTNACSKISQGVKKVTINNSNFQLYLHEDSYNWFYKHCANPTAEELAESVKNPNVWVQNWFGTEILIELIANGSVVASQKRIVKLWAAHDLYKPCISGLTDMCFPKGTTIKFKIGKLSKEQLSSIDQIKVTKKPSISL